MRKQICSHELGIWFLNSSSWSQVVMVSSVVTTCYHHIISCPWGLPKHIRTASQQYICSPTTNFWFKHLVHFVTGRLQFSKESCRPFTLQYLNQNSAKFPATFPYNINMLRLFCPATSSSHHHGSGKNRSLQDYYPHHCPQTSGCSLAVPSSQSSQPHIPPYPYISDIPQNHIQVPKNTTWKAPVSLAKSQPTLLLNNHHHLFGSSMAHGFSWLALASHLVSPMCPGHPGHPYIPASAGSWPLPPPDRMATWPLSRCHVDDTNTLTWRICLQKAPFKRPKPIQMRDVYTYMYN